MSLKYGDTCGADNIAMLLTKYYEVGGGRHSTEVEFALSDPAAPGLILGVPKKFNLDVTQMYRLQIY